MTEMPGGSPRPAARLYLVGILYYLPLMWWPVARYDEGVTLVGAQRMLAGEIPYRDFWSLYGPAEFSVLAALFRVLGESLFVSRGAEVLLRALLPVLGFLLADRAGDRRGALTVWVLLLVWLWQFAPTNYPVIPALALILGGTLLLLHARWLAAGALVGLAAGFRHDLGAYALAAHLLALAWTRRDGVIRYLLGVGMTGAPTALLLVLLVPWTELTGALWSFPAHVYPAFRGLPHPLARHELVFGVGPVGAAFHLVRPLAAALVVGLPLTLVACALWSRRAWPRLSSDARPAVLALLLLAAFLLRTALVRSDIAHLLPVSIPILILIPVLLRSHPLPRLLGAATGIAILLATAGAVVTGSPRLVFTLPCPGSGLAPALAARAGGACVPDDQAAAVEAVAALVPPGGRIFVGATEHDRVLAGDLSFYYLADRLPGTRYHELHPGLTTTRDVQERIIRELERFGVQVVVRVEGGFWEEPNASRESSGVFVLDRYLESRFRHPARFGRYTVLRRCAEPGCGSGAGEGR